MLSILVQITPIGLGPINYFFAFLKPKFNKYQSVCVRDKKKVGLKFVTSFYNCFVVFAKKDLFFFF